MYFRKTWRYANINSYANDSYVLLKFCSRPIWNNFVCTIEYTTYTQQVMAPLLASGFTVNDVEKDHYEDEIIPNYLS